MARQHTLSAAEIDAQIPRARARESAARKLGLRAEAAYYDAAEERIVMTLTNGYLFGFPVRIIPALARATPRQLATVQVSPAGSGLHWADLDVDLSVPGLLLSPMSPAQRARELARIAGQATSPAKAAAARENGTKGGRPRLGRTARSSLRPDEATALTRGNG